jgi:hypothetical protein
VRADSQSLKQQDADRSRIKMQVDALAPEVESFQEREGLEMKVCARVR